MDTPAIDTSGSQSTAENQQSKKLIDSIVYLASLASRREDIELMMDPLRNVTSRWEGGAMTETDRQSLINLEAQLKTYLVHNDPLRTFTPESLEQRLRDRATGLSTPSGKNRRHLAIVLGGSLAATALTLVLLPASVDLSNRLLIAIQPFYVILCIGTNWFYLTALKNFRPELRRAFVYMCLGVIFMAINFSIDALVTLFGLGKLPAFQYGGPLWAVALSFFFMYLGLRIYARLLGFNSTFTSLWRVALVCVPLAIAAVLAPHSSRATNEFFFDLSFTSGVVFLVLMILGAIIARDIAKNVTAAFTRSMRWIFIYLVACIPGTLAGLASLLYFGQMYGRGLNFILATAGITPLLLLFYTGYSFKKETGK